MRKCLVLTILLSCLHIATRGQTTPEVDLSWVPQPTQVKNLRYWFDNDATSVTASNATNGVYSINVSSLTEGLHTLHYQVMGQDGKAGFIASSVFIKIGDGAESLTAPKLMYWFDNETNVRQFDITGSVQMLDASSLIDGLHIMHYQMKDIHGTLGSLSSALFMKMDAATASSVQQLRYWFDDDPTTMRVTNVTNGTQALDVSTLLTGLHTLNYQLMDSDGKVGTPVTRIFMKNFDKVVEGGQNRIMKYQYWLNRNSQTMQTVSLDNAANPYTLISLLTMPQEPIHTDMFHFEVTDGQPTVYAKNVFHIRFHDATSYLSEGQKTFVDYGVKQEVMPVGELQANQTFNRVAENEILWYSLNVEPGDTVAFKTSQACSIQLFSQSGEEVYSAMGATSVAFGGCYTWESGTYYLAIHDVTGSKSKITLDYMHMDKYDVVRQDVSVVGNGGCSTITFEGNGFKDLYAVELTDGNGNTIEHVDIGHESDATTSVTFDFANAQLGTYNAVFHFADEDKVFSDLVTVEEAKDIELMTTVTYPSIFRRGTSTTYTIKIVNKGNMTAYAVPIEIQLLTQGQDDITSIKLSENAPSLVVDWLNDPETPDDCIKAFKEYVESKGDFLHFLPVINSIDERYIKEAHFAIDIAPYSSYVLTVSIKSNETVELQTMVPSNWYSCISTNSKKHTSKARRRISKEGMCCVREKVECAMNVVVAAFDAASILPQANLADCIASLGNTTLQYAYDVWCGEEYGGKNPRNAMEDLVWDAINGLIGCAIPNTEKWMMLSSLQWVYQHIYNNISTTIDCLSALTQRIPNCPPNPGGGGGPSTPVVSVDPNDIYGYTAESGSKAIKDGQADVYYTIEFENDPEFATASAHDVYVTDMLDATKFDLSTFAPTRVKIGEKTAELSGDPNFVTTIDMRPEINAIAQVEGTFDEQTGVARWHISSLDPMTMEPTEEVMDGVLPVNSNGNGIGEVSFDISLKDGLVHGTEIPNSASIVFDTNEAITTPVWTNIIDRVAPESHITNVEQVDGSTATVSIEATDELSGAWHYNVYVQYGSGAWFLGAENVPIDSEARVKVYEGVDHHFYTIATDGAGNVEQKEPVVEFTLSVDSTSGDLNGDGVVDVVDVVRIINIAISSVYNKAADLNGDGVVDVLDVTRLMNLAVGNK